jgi:hypothetical protein
VQAGISNPRRNEKPIHDSAAVSFDTAESILPSSYSTMLSNQAELQSLPTTCHNIQISDEEHFFSTQFCQPVDAKTIEKRIAGKFTPEQKTSFVNIMQDIMNSHPDIGQSINIAFNYIPGFKILLVPEKDITAALGEVAFYIAATKTMILHSDFEKYKMYEPIRHEFRHAMWHAIQIAHSKSPTYSSDCWLPNDLEERQKILLLEQKN